MVEEGVSDDRKTERVPAFDAEDFKTWKTRLEIFLMRKSQADEGLLAKPVLAAGGLNTLTDRQDALAAELIPWKKAKAIAYSYAMQAVEGHPEALLVARSYHASKAEATPRLEVAPYELLAALETRFLGITQTRLEKVQGLYNSFAITSQSDVSAGLDQLNAFIQTLAQMGQPPTEASKCEKLKTSIRGQARFKQLAINLAMFPVTTTYDQFGEACRRYDEAVKEEESGTSVNFVNKEFTPEQKERWLKRKKAQAKRAAGAKRDAPPPKGRELATIDCYNCGKLGHYQNQCTQKKQKRAATNDHKPNAKKSKKKGAKNGNWPKGKGQILVDDDDEDDDDDGNDSNMIGGNDSDEDEDEMDEADSQLNSITTSAHSNASQRIYIDSCASAGLCIVNNAGVLDRVTQHQVTHINLTRRGASMTTQGEGCIGTWSGITICQDSQKNIISVDRLKTAGYGLVQLKDDHVVDLDTQEELIECAHNKGMPFVLMHDLFALMDKSTSQV
jgi:hypothetical protein